MAELELDYDVLEDVGGHPAAPEAAGAAVIGAASGSGGEGATAAPPVPAPAPGTATPVQLGKRKLSTGGGGGSGGGGQQAPAQQQQQHPASAPKPGKPVFSLEVFRASGVQLRDPADLEALEVLTKHPEHVPDDIHKAMSKRAAGRLGTLRKQFAAPAAPAAPPAEDAPAAKRARVEEGAGPAAAPATSETPTPTLVISNLQRPWKEGALQEELRGTGAALVEPSGGDAEASAAAGSAEAPAPAASWTDSMRTVFYQDFATPDDAAKALAALNGKAWPPVHGRALSVAFSAVSAAQAAGAEAAAKAAARVAAAAAASAAAAPPADSGSARPPVQVTRVMNASGVVTVTPAVDGAQPAAAAAAAAAAAPGDNAAADGGATARSAGGGRDDAHSTWMPTEREIADGAQVPPFYVEALHPDASAQRGAPNIHDVMARGEIPPMSE